MSCIDKVRQLLHAIEVGDQEAFERLVSPSLRWETSGSEGGPETLGRLQLAGFIDQLRSYDDRRRVKEVVEIAGSVVVRAEGTITPPGRITFGGTGFEI